MRRHVTPLAPRTSTTTASVLAEPAWAAAFSEVFSSMSIFDEVSAIAAGCTVYEYQQVAPIGPQIHRSFDLAPGR